MWLSKGFHLNGIIAEFLPYLTLSLKLWNYLTSLHSGRKENSYLRIEILSKVFTLLFRATDLFTENVTVYFCIKVKRMATFYTLPPPPSAVQILSN